MAKRICDLNTLVLATEANLKAKRDAYQEAVQDRQALIVSIGGTVIYHSIANKFKPNVNNATLKDT